MEIISAKYLLTLDSEPVEDGAIAVELGRIKGVGNRADLKKAYPNAKEENYPDHILMPGLINAHTQLDLTDTYNQTYEILSGKTEKVDYIDWLINTIEYRQSANLREVINAVQKGASQLINSGTTCIGDMTIFEGTLNILTEMGLRAVVFSEIYSGKGEQAQDLFESALAIVEKYSDPQDERKLRVGLGPTAPYLLSKNLLRIVAQHVQEAEIPLAIHAAESFAEMEFFFDSKGPIGGKLFPSIGWGAELPPAHQKTPVCYLSEIGFLDASPAIIGGIHLSEKCYDALAKNMCKIIYCPTSNTYFGHGALPLAKLYKCEIPISLGTGPIHSSRGLSIWDEMREALKLSNNAVSPKQIVEMATIGGAKTLGVTPIAGTLTKGKMADYIIVDLPPGYEIDKSYIYGALIRNTNSHHVKRVVVAGEVLKSS